MIMDKFSLKDQVGIVTGGGQGLGEAFCLAFAEAGAHVVVAEQNPKTGPAMAARVESMGRRGLFVQTDVANLASARGMVEKTLEVFGRVDFLMNNAGIVHWDPAETVSEADWRRVIDVNLNGVFFCCQAAAAPMIERRSGRIINIASMSGSIVNFPQSQASYNASKAAVVHLTRSLASEWAPHNIRVNAIAPGYMRTALNTAYLDDPKLGGVWAEATPMKRVGRPEELGPVAVFLASEASSFVTGTTITVDGGYTIW